MMGRRKTAAWKRKISEGVKKAYREGRITPPTKRPEVAAKISAAKKLNNAVTRPEVRAKISATLRRKFASGEIKHGVLSDAGRERISNAHKGPRSEETRRKISEGLKKSWQRGDYINREPTKWSTTPTPAEEILIDPLLKLGFNFRRVFPIKQPGRMGGRTYYCPDFTHDEAKICIEIDGPAHKDQVKIVQCDKAKHLFLRKLGYTTLRFTNEEVISDPMLIVKKIRTHL